MSWKQLNLNELPATGPREIIVSQRRIVAFLITTGVLALLFSRVLVELSIFSARSELYSYILLVPPISFYLFWTTKGSQRKEATSGGGNRIWFAVGITTAMILLW